MVKVKVYVTLKSGVLDPQGKAVKAGLHSLNFPEVQDVRIGKYMELLLDRTVDIEDKIEQMCGRLLANPVIEDYRYELEEVVSL